MALKEETDSQIKELLAKALFDRRVPHTVLRFSLYRKLKTR